MVLRTFQLDNSKVLSDVLVGSWPKSAWRPLSPQIVTASILKHCWGSSTLNRLPEISTWPHQYSVWFVVRSSAWTVIKHFILHLDNTFEIADMRIFRYWMRLVPADWTKEHLINGFDRCQACRGLIWCHHHFPPKQSEAAAVWEFHRLPSLSCSSSSKQRRQS